MKSFLPAFFSLVILTAIFVNLELTELYKVFSNINLIWFALGIILFVPIYLILAIRLNFLSSFKISMADSINLILAAGALNTVLPSKGGDLGKAFFMTRYLDWNKMTCISAVVLERMVDVAVLLILMFAGLAFIEHRTIFVSIIILTGGLGILPIVIIYFILNWKYWTVFQSNRHFRRIPLLSQFYIHSHKFVSAFLWNGRIWRLIGYSLISWIIQLVQIYCFFLATGFNGPVITILGLVPIAIIIGLIPITLAGIGTRDAALIILFSPWASTETMAATALLSHLRYVLPGLIGIPAVQREILKNWGKETA